MELKRGSEESQFAFELFTKMSHFMRYQLDQVLPHCVSKCKLNIPEEIKTESENLLISVKTFAQFVKTVENTFKDEPKKAETELWPDVLFEMFNSIDETGVVRKAGHYCGICNYSTFDIKSWNHHYLEDPVHAQHDRLIKLESPGLVEGTFCKFCKLVVYSERPHMDIIFNSNFHQALDSQIQKLENGESKMKSKVVGSRPNSPHHIEFRAPNLPPPFSSQKPALKENTPKKKEVPKPKSDQKIKKKTPNGEIPKDIPQKKPNKIVQEPQNQIPNEKKKKKKNKIPIQTNTNQTIEIPIEPNQKPPIEPSPGEYGSIYQLSGSEEDMLMELYSYKKIRYENDGIIIFAGLCLICKSLIDNMTDWDSHVSSHLNRIQGCEVKQCTECVTSFYGYPQSIETHYFKSQIHQNIHGIEAKNPQQSSNKWQ